MEKSLFAQAGEIRGKKDEVSLTATFQFTPSEEHLKQTRGTLFFLIWLKEEASDKALTDSRHLFEAFKDKFYAGVGSNLKALELAAEDLKNLIGQSGTTAGFVAANLWGSVLYLAKFGGTGVILVREGTVKKIDFAKVASGSLFDNDTVFLTDPLFLENTDLEPLSQVSVKSDFEEILTAVGETAKEKGGAFCLRLSVQEPVERLEPLLIADLSEREKGVPGPLSELGRKISFRWPALRLNLDFLLKFQMALKKVATVLAPLVQEYLRKTAAFVLSPWLPRPPGVLEDEAWRKRKRIIEIAAVLAAILLVSISAGSINRARHASTERREKTISAVENKLDEAEKLKNINPANAANLVSEAEKELNTLSSKDPKYVNLREKLDVLSAEINRVFQVGLETFVDLTNLKGKIEAKKLKLAAGFLLVLDKGTGSVYKVETASKKISILVSEKADLQNIAAAGELLYIQSKDGVKRIDLQTKAEKKLVSSSAKWQKLVAADTYRGNLYLLDEAAKQIWKYLPVGDGLAGPANYFSEAFNETLVDFTVDGNVWIASKNTIFKFFGGKKQAFEVKNSPQPFSEIADIYTREGNSNLYIFDKGAGGLFIIEKSSGSYSGLYLADKLKEASCLVVDEVKKTTYVLVGNIIYSFNLR